MLVVLGACDLGDAGEPTSSDTGFTQYDSAGVIISVTPAAEANAPLEWKIDPDEVLRIGEGGSPDEEFFRIGGVQQLPGGEVVVADGGSGELRVFSPDGILKARFGRFGDGPEEFRDPSLVVPAFGFDSLLVFDSRFRPSFHVISPDGEGWRRLGPWTIGPYGRLPSSRAPLGASGSRVLMDGALHTPRITGPGVHERPRTLHWVDLESDDRTTIARFAIGRTFVAEWSDDRPPFTWAIPFLNLSPPAAVAPDGAFVTLHEPEVEKYDLDGTLSRIFRVEGAARTVTRAHMDADIEVRVRRTTLSRAEYETRLARMPLPETLPAFQHLQVDDLGWLWAEIYEVGPDPPTRWMIFDPDGRAHGTLEALPGFTAHHIGEDFILGVWTDDLGVEYVQRHPLQRR